MFSDGKKLFTCVSKETLESVFIILLQTLAPLHIKPAFDT
jgi:hypothetical protein